MNERQSGGVQNLTGLTESVPAQGIDWIANDRMADVLAMNPDLMRPACLKIDLQPGCLARRPQP